ncbi:MAG TPA: hypothetical protein VFV80_11555 [Geminicoccaceae bacterium]|nr:hypothetical protein [Geminicoccaceae bacterium]
MRPRRIYGGATADQRIASRDALSQSPEVGRVFADPFVARLQLAGGAAPRPLCNRGRTP